MAGAVITFMIFVVFLILAVVLSKGKGANFIAGYNTMPESEKAKYDEVAMCKFMGKMMYGFSFSVLLWGISALLDNQLYFVIGMIIFVLFMVWTLVYFNTGNRFKKNID